MTKTKILNKRSCIACDQDKLESVIADFESQFIGIQNPKFRATSKGNDVVIENRRHNQGLIESDGHQNDVLELGKLVAGPAVKGVPEQFLSDTSRLGIPPGK